MQKRARALDGLHALPFAYPKLNIQISKSNQGENVSFNELKLNHDSYFTNVDTCVPTYQFLCVDVDVS